MSAPDAIVLRGVHKSFKKTSRRNDHSTFKSELVRLLTLQRKPQETPQVISALRGVDLTIKKGQTIGIIGRNGSGKSTLLKLLTGIYAPTEGTVTVNGRISALLELGAGFHPDFTGRENILINGIILGMSRPELKKRMPEIIEFAELGDFIDEPVRVYSSGMFMRLAFAVATHVDPEVLIIDEILSVGDEHFGRKSQAKMNAFRRDGKTIVLVTHDLGSVESWCDSAAWIDGGVIRRHGPAAEIVAEYRRAVSAAEAEGQRSGHSALSVPGAALPALETQVEGPRAEVREVRVSWGDGPLTAESSLSLELQPHAHQDGATLAVDVTQADGRMLFSVSYALTASTTTLNLTIERLGLSAGTYELAVSVEHGGHRSAPVRRALQVTAGLSSPHVGPLSPAHRWSASP